MRSDSQVPVDSTVSEVPLPNRIRRSTELERIDYSDTFLVPDLVAPHDLSPEQWAREVLEGAPAPLRRKLVRGWFLLGLRHGSVHSSGHVLGWPIRHNTDELIVLSARSRIGMPAELVFARQGEGWLFATLVRHDNRIVSLVWRTIAESHRRVVGYLLRSAAARRRA